MTTTDPFAHFDAAYVLGALSPADRAAFEAHLGGCAECRARVHEVAAVPTLLADVPEEAFQAVGADDVPDTLLPALLRRARAERRRRYAVTGLLAGVVAACLVAIGVLVWPSSTSTSAPKPVAMQAVLPSRVTATAVLSTKSWGTEIQLACNYTGTGATSRYGYRLVVVDRWGAEHELGSWQLIPGKTIRYTSGTGLQRSDIARIEITTPDEQPVLQLTL